ncbi:RHS repeat-associated core domain-containing protein [Xylocopilactobacillus apicola]|uniref:RHS repeat domain-containing protein n=1 Tax=Xylocopilactobacillus apicola TaxID=2932184 RepID=UPI002955749F|nr:RHS repeat-associated core domain-containing protein [Xylocopilactobacillus apicola]
MVWQANYKAWGEIESCRINDIEQNLRYQGQYFDEETELHYNTFRYYDSQVGRFTTQDPIGLIHLVGVEIQRQVRKSLIKEKVEGCI